MTGDIVHDRVNAPGPTTQRLNIRVDGYYRLERKLGSVTGKSSEAKRTLTRLTLLTPLKSDNVDAVIDAAYPLDLLKSVLQQLFQIKCGHTSANHECIFSALTLKSVRSTF
jgi:hypothetical protein